MQRSQQSRIMRRIRILALVGILVISSMSVRTSATAQAASPGDAAPWFDATGAHLGAVTLRLAALGRDDTPTALAPAPPEDDGTRVQYRHGDATEWYVRQGGGIEQGVTLTARPAGDDPLVLAIATPDLTPVIDADGAGATLVQPMAGRATEWRYADLHVTDATGQTLPSHLEAVAGGLAVVVDDREAVYPLVVDPALVPQTTLADPRATANDYFGTVAAVSADGSTLVVGATGASAMYVFTKSGSAFPTTPTQVLTEPDGPSQDSFPTAVAVSGDGSTLVATTPYTSGSQGKVYIYAKSGGSYSNPPTQTLVDPNAMNHDEFGYAVALSADGSTLVVGADGVSTYQGRAYLYAKSGGSYPSSPTQTLAEPSAANFHQFGDAVALSADGSTLVVGANHSNDNQGAAYVFTKSGGSFSPTPSQAFTNPNGAISESFGWSVALSADGNTLIVSAPLSNNNGGRVYVYTKSGGSFGAARALVGANTASDQFGWSVAASRDGSILIVGARSALGQQGQAYLYAKSGSSYGTPFILSDPAATSNDVFGNAVAVTGDGHTVIVGAYGTNNNQGATYIYVAAPVATGHHYTTARNVPLVIAPPSGLLIGSSSGFPDIATVTAHSTPANGTVSTNADGSFTYTPNSGFSGADSFTYTLTNSAGTSTGTVTITVANGTIAPQPAPKPAGGMSGNSPGQQPPAMAHPGGTVNGNAPSSQPARH